MPDPRNNKGRKRKPVRSRAAKASAPQASAPQAPASQSPAELEFILDDLQKVYGRIKGQTEMIRNACGAIDAKRADYERMAWGGPWPTMVVDCGGVITQASAGLAEMLGMDREEIVGRPLAALVVREHAQRVIEDLSFCAQSPTAQQIECDLCSPHGTLIPVIASCQAASGRGTGAVRVALTDISHRKRTEKVLRDNAEQLAAANLALAGKSEQLRHMSAQLVMAEQNERRRIADLLHDHVQQLLVASKMRLDVMISHHPEIGERGKTLLGVLQEAIESLRSLSVELRPPALQERGLCATLSWLAEWMHKKHSLRVEVQADPAADRLSLEVQVALFQAIRELLFNVVKHSGVLKARVTLAHDEPTDEIVVTVADRGVGLDTSRMWASEFGHLGIPSIRERLHALGSDLEVDSTPGAGTRVTIRAKLGADAGSPDDLALEGDTPDSIVAGVRGEGVRVLIVDDHALVRQGVSLLLHHQPGIEVVGEAANGREALEMVRRHAPDVILMDINMPEMNGIEATRRVKQLMPQVVVIGLSMHDLSELAQAMRDAGADGYVNKAAPSDELIRAIRGHVEKHELPAQKMRLVTA